MTLAGTVDFRFQRNATENLVRPLTGITGIDNRLRIRPMMDVLDIRHGIRAALKRKMQEYPAVTYAAWEGSKPASEPPSRRHGR